MMVPLTPGSPGSTHSFICTMLPGENFNIFVPNGKTRFLLKDRGGGV
jgi:hypothetical protein